MKGKFVLLSGTASQECPPDRLDVAIRFVQLFVAEVLKAGGGMVVLGNDESQTKDPDGRPRVFDWTVLRAVEEFASVTTRSPRTYVRVVMSENAWQTKLDDGNRSTLENLQQRGVVDISRIRRQEYAGSSYRAMEYELSDGMIALGGGKGTYIAGKEMIKVGKPVLPLDLDIGGFSEDGEGALALHRELLSNPSEFFPNTHTRVAHRIETLSLTGADRNLTEVTQRVTEVMGTELSGIGYRFRKLLGYVSGGVSKFLAAIGIIRAIVFLKQFFLGA